MIHLRPIPKTQQNKRADVRVRSKLYDDTHRRLRQEIEEEAISRELVVRINADKHTRKSAASDAFHRTGDFTCS